MKSFLYSIIRNLWLSEMRKRNNADNRNRVFEKEKILKSRQWYRIWSKGISKSILDLFEKLGEKCKQLLLLFITKTFP